MLELKQTINQHPNPHESETTSNSTHKPFRTMGKQNSLVSSADTARSPDKWSSSSVICDPSQGGPQFNAPYNWKEITSREI